MDSIANRYLEAARERLREFGVALKVERQQPGEAIDAVVTLSHEGQGQRYAVMVKEPMTLSSVASDAHRLAVENRHPPLILGNRVSRRSADALRNSGIQFVDALGNAFIAFGNVLVEVQGRTEPTPQVAYEYETPRRFRPVNIFSSRRSQVILALLAWPELATGNIRQIALAAGISTGQAHDAITKLQDAGFLVADSKRLDRVDELLDLWTAAYPAGLGQRLEIARYHGDLSRPLVGSASGETPYLSGESAMGSGVVRPAALTLYLHHLDSKFPIRNRWSASPDRPANVFVRHKFWVSPHSDDEPDSAEVQNAPWPLVYADLMATRDARLGEVAREWRARFARPDQV